MFFGDGRGVNYERAASAGLQAVFNGPIQRAVSEYDFPFATANPFYSANWTSAPTRWSNLKIYRSRDRKWRSNLTYESRLPSGFGSFGVTWIDPLNGNNSNDGSTPALAKLTIGTLWSDSTNRVLMIRDCGYDVTTALAEGDYETVRLALKSGYAVLNSGSAGGNDLGGHKILRSWTRGRQFLATGLLGTDDITWALDATLGLWKTTTTSAVSGSPGAIIDFGRTNAFGAPIRALGQTAATKTVSGAVDNGSGLIRLTVTGHGYTTGTKIFAYGIGGVMAANNNWVVTEVDANTLDLDGSVFAGTYTSGGTTATNATLFSTQNTCCLVNSATLYYNNGSTTVAPRADATFVSIGSSRYRHNNPNYELSVEDGCFLGGSTVFSSTCGFLITSGVNNAGTYRFTTASAHGFSNGDSVTLQGVANVPGTVNAAHTISGVTSTTFDIPIAFTTTATANTGIANRLSLPIQQSFWRTGFAFGCTSSSNAVQFEGHGFTVLSECALTDSSTDVIDWRARRWGVKERCTVRNAGATVPATTNNLNQTCTGHSGSFVLDIDCLHENAIGALIQDVSENGVASHRMIFGSFTAGNYATASPAGFQVGIRIGTDGSVSDASTMYIVDHTYADRRGLNAPTRWFTLCNGSSVAHNAYSVATNYNRLGSPAVTEAAQFTFV
jgi:hypothetical protein